MASHLKNSYKIAINFFWSLVHLRGPRDCGGQQGLSVFKDRNSKTFKSTNGDKGGFT